MTAESAIDISQDERAIVRSILQRHLPAGADIWVFGSRAVGTARCGSDLDLAIKTDSPLTHKEMTTLSLAFEESGLPYTVDLVELSKINEAFRAIILRDGVRFVLDGRG